MHNLKLLKLFHHPPYSATPPFPALSLSTAPSPLPCQYISTNRVLNLHFLTSIIPTHPSFSANTSPSACLNLQHCSTTPQLYQNPPPLLTFHFCTQCFISLCSIFLDSVTIIMNGVESGYRLCWVSKMIPKQVNNAYTVTAMISSSSVEELLNDI